MQGRGRHWNHVGGTVGATQGAMQCGSSRAGKNSREGNGISKFPSSVQFLENNQSTVLFSKNCRFGGCAKLNSDF